MNWMTWRYGRISFAGSAVISRPCRRMVPDVGSISLTIMRAAVDLPQPDSPTSPSVSPGKTENEMPSTANTAPCRRPSSPPRTAKCLTRSMTSRMGSTSAIGDLHCPLRMPAGGEVVGRLLRDGRRRAAAFLGGERAARGKGATRKALAQRREHARDFGQPGLGGLGQGLELRRPAHDPRHRAQEPDGIGVAWPPKELGYRRLLDLAAGVH